MSMTMELTVMWQLIEECNVDVLKTLNVAELPDFERRHQSNLTEQFSAQLTEYHTQTR